MSSRISRSASIPIPNSNSAARNIENAISIPFTSQPARPRLVSNTRLQLVSGPTAAGSRAPVSSPAAARSLSGSYSSSAMRSPSTQTFASTYEPRIIRATTGSAAHANAATDPACVPASAPPVSSMSMGVSRMRRPSVARVPPVPSLRTAPQPVSVSSIGVGASSSTSSVAISSSAPASAPPVPPAAQPFARPAYLEHSALRDLLFTDAPPLVPAPPAPDTHAHHGPSTSRVSTPIPPHAAYPYLRRDRTPNLDTDDESSASPPPPSVRGTPAPAAAAAVTGALLINPTLRLPTRWSDTDRHHALSVTSEGRELSFYGPSCIGERDSAAARANYPIPPACGIYYYEVEILHKGGKGHISIGFSSGEVRLTRLPGWEKHSWGYHADDGWIFPGMKEGMAYGPTYDTGDIIGCGIDFTQNRAFYTKNGSFLGMAFENVGKGFDIFPSIGMRHTNESVRVNFGHSPFKYAIEDHVDAQRNAVWAGIQGTRIDWEVLHAQGRVSAEDEGTKEVPAKASEEDEQTQAPIRKLVLAYLAHHGYARTARAFQAQCERVGEASTSITSTSTTSAVAASTSRAGSSMSSGSGSGLDAEYDLRARIDIVNAVLKGDVDAAIDQTQAHHPSVLEREQGLMLFKLRCRKFVELILEASDALKRVQGEEPRGRTGGREENGERERRNGNGNAGSELDGDAEADGDGEEDAEEANAVDDAMAVEQDGVDGAGAMDVDEPVPTAASHLTTSRPSATPSPSSSPSPLAALARSALHTAINYGQQLEAEYKGDARPEVRVHLKRTFGVVAFADPLAAGGEVAEMAGQEARARLANELNQAILESQGKPAHPALETLYRQTGACVVQLGLLGVGAAAFADMEKEFLET